MSPAFGCIGSVRGAFRLRVFAPGARSPRYWLLNLLFFKIHHPETTPETDQIQTGRGDSARALKRPMKPHARLTLLAIWRDLE